jgi:hypothetical protein
MDAFTQMALVSKISPLLASGFGEAIPIVVSLRKEGMKNLADMPLEKLAAILTPVSRELAKMTNDDRLYIIGTCLNLCDRKHDGEQSFTKVWNDTAGRAMFDDINNDLSLMLRIVIGVLQVTFSSFFPESLSGSFGKASNQSSIQSG